MKLKLFVVAIFIVGLSIAHPNDGYEACRERYLRLKGLIESDFYSVEQIGPTLGSYCEGVMESFINSYYINLLTSVKKVEVLVPISECVRDEMKKINIIDITLTKAFYDQFELVQAKALSAKAETEIGEKTEDAIEICKAGRTFDSIFSAPDDPLDGLEEKYCIKKYLIENNLRSSTDGDVQVVSNNCTEIIDGMKTKTDQMYIDLYGKQTAGTTDTEKQCVEKAISDRKMFEVVFKLLVLKSVKASDELRDNERAGFIATTQNIIADVKKCSIV